MKFCATAACTTAADAELGMTETRRPEDLDGAAPVAGGRGEVGGRGELLAELGAAAAAFRVEAPLASTERPPGFFFSLEAIAGRLLAGLDLSASTVRDAHVPVL